MLKSEVLVSSLTSLALLFCSNTAHADSPTDVMLPSEGVRVVVGFSPEGSAQKAILDLINSAQQEIRMGAYSFTSPVIAKALVNAHRRGVDVRIVVDKEQNKNRYAVSAMNAVANAGIPVRTNDQFLLHHDKYLCIDQVSVETGSFNYSSSAMKNSENSLVLYNVPDVTAQYLAHWESRWAGGVDYIPNY
ncbi:phospholipase D family protein [Citrobacter amalonaticus]|nr:phospholipase D family protein [Citrobacter amalonaticus]